VIIFVSVLRGAGDTRFVMINSFIMASLMALGTYIGVNKLGFTVYDAWWFIAIWVFALAVIYVLRYRTGKWQEMRVIDQIHHAHGAPPVRKDATGREDLEEVEAAGAS
jgi:MATE family multidrug resistance protein